jgi:hypothetical protein
MWLGYSRIIALVTSIIGLLVVVAALVGAAESAIIVGGIAWIGAIPWIIYGALDAVVSFLIWTRIPELELLVNQGNYEGAKGQHVLWMILGLIFGFVILGIFLLLAFLNYDPLINWQRGGGVPYATPPIYGTPAATGYAPYAGPGNPAASAPPPNASPPGNPSAWGSPGYASAPASPSPIPPSYGSSPQPGAVVANANAQAQGPSPTAPGLLVNCRICGQPTTFIPQYSRYYCYQCSQYV